MICVGRAYLSARADLQNNAGRVAHVQEIDGAIEAWTAGREVAEVLDAMGAARIPAGRVYTVADIVQDPQYLAREMILHHTAFDGEQVAIPGIVPKLSATPGSVRERAPTLGEHTDAVLRELGFEIDQIERWRAGGIIR
jgi:formyl-CoA transferase